MRLNVAFEADAGKLTDRGTDVNKTARWQDGKEDNKPIQKAHHP
jgi:hypothetical protein